MTDCDRYRQQIPECLAGWLDKAARELLVEHLEGCSGCRAELAAMGRVWRGMEALGGEEPGPELAERFRETLHAFAAGLAQAQREPSKRPRGWLGWMPHPAWQLAGAAALLIIGLAAGRFLTVSRQPETSVAQLQGQVENLRQLVSLSMLNQSSPGSRLEGVVYAQQLTRPDNEVEQALVQAARQDPNVNVRLAAVDGLGRYGSDPAVRRTLADGLVREESPLVQVALIEFLVNAHARDCALEIKQLAASTDAEPIVRQRAEWGLKQLGLSQ
ncbi:MAG: HEAT repeat domain-containing protein [Bryobacteraceae bacterium]